MRSDPRCVSVLLVAVILLAACSAGDASPAATPTPASTATPTPTAAPSLTPTPVDPAVELALAGVSTNDEWTPVYREFDGVLMALVPSGCFMMGYDYSYYDFVYEEELPEHQQCIDEPF